MTDRFRPAWVEVDLAAVRANVTTLAERAAPSAVWAVVKADAYGHGAVPVARAALDAGAYGLGVALVEEGIELRAAGIDAPILVLSEPVVDAASAVVQYRLTPVVYSAAGIDALAKAVADARAGGPLDVHLKVDTGMHRVGCAPSEACERARAVASAAELRLAAVCTHFASADDPDDAATGAQLRVFADVVAALEGASLRPPMTHAANTAAVLAFPRACFDQVRVGIGVYGIAPSAALAEAAPLRPALSFGARVTYVKRLAAGDRVSYGLGYRVDRPSTIATVPVGYADGVPRALGIVGGEVLLHGHRVPIAGAVTMDQLLVDAGDLPVAVGDEVMLIGRQGAQHVTATEWAEKVGTIPYEIVCGIGGRVPRRYVRG